MMSYVDRTDRMASQWKESERLSYMVRTERMASQSRGEQLE